MHPLSFTPTVADGAVSGEGAAGGVQGAGADRQRVLPGRRESGGRPALHRHYGRRLVGAGGAASSTQVIVK